MLVLQHIPSELGTLIPLKHSQAQMYTRTPGIEWNITILTIFDSQLWIYPLSTTSLSLSLSVMSLRCWDLIAMFMGNWDYPLPPDMHDSWLQWRSRGEALRQASLVVSSLIQLTLSLLSSAKFECRAPWIS